MVQIKRRLYRCLLNSTLSKLIVDNGLEYLWRRENPDSSEFTHYDRSSDTRSRIYRVYIDKNASNTKINHIMVSFADIIMLFLLTDSPQKLKLGNTHGTLIILFYVSLSYSQLKRLFFFY